MAQSKIRKNGKHAKAFIRDVKVALVAGKKYQIPGFGTFSSCSRKDSLGRVICKIAMFRASSELRDFAAGGSFPDISSAHTEIITRIINAMQDSLGVEIPEFGRMAFVADKGKSLKIIFHSADEFNYALSGST